MRLIKTILLTVIGLIAVLAAVVILSLRPNIPATTVELTPPASVGNLNVLVFGGTRNTGLEVVKLLTVRGDKVTAFVRPTSDRSALEPLGVDFAVGDAMEPESVDRAFETSEFDAVLTTIGSLRANPPPDYEGNVNIFAAAKRAGVDRVVMVSTIGAGDSNSAAPWLSKLAIAKLLPLKTQAEDYLRASGLDYTIVRPGGLPPGAPATGRGLLSEDTATFGFIGRPDLARLIVGILDDDKTIGKTYAAIDPERTSPWDSD